MSAALLQTTTLYLVVGVVIANPLNYPAPPVGGSMTALLLPSACPFVVVAKRDDAVLVNSRVSDPESMATV